MLDQQFSISLLTMVFLQFRLFVRVCYVCNLGSHYKKLSNRVIKCVFVGYSPKCVIKKKKKFPQNFMILLWQEMSMNVGLFADIPYYSIEGKNHECLKRKCLRLFFQLLNWKKLSDLILLFLGLIVTWIKSLQCVKNLLKPAGLHKDTKTNSFLLKTH